MTHTRFTRMLDDWGYLGGSVQEQAMSVWNGEPLPEQNPNALKYIRDWADEFADVHEDIATLSEMLSDESEWESTEDDEL